MWLPCKVDSFIGVDDFTEDDMRAFLNKEKVSLATQSTCGEILQTFHLYKDEEEDLFSKAINET